MPVPIAPPSRSGRTRKAMFETDQERLDAIVHRAYSNFGLPEFVDEHGIQYCTDQTSEFWITVPTRSNQVVLRSRIPRTVASNDRKEGRPSAKQPDMSEHRQFWLASQDQEATNPSYNFTCIQGLVKEGRHCNVLLGTLVPIKIT